MSSFHFIPIYTSSPLLISVKSELCSCASIIARARCRALQRDLLLIFIPKINFCPALYVQTVQVYTCIDGRHSPTFCLQCVGCVSCSVAI